MRSYRWWQKMPIENPVSAIQINGKLGSDPADRPTPIGTHEA